MARRFETHASPVNPRSYLSQPYSGEIAPQYLAELNQKIAGFARLLLAKGSDVSIETNNGNTALKWAEVRKNKPLIALPKKVGAK